ncbi:molybdopterin-dependent oxidoreductase, partial [Streptomyces coelicoflavus]
TASHPGAYVPESANGGFAAVTEHGDPDGALASSATRVDVAYSVPPLHNHPMEPHTSTAHWDGDRLTVHSSSQGSTAVQKELARLFGLPEDRITVRAEHVGGGFGSKGTPRPEVVLAAM